MNYKLSWSIVNGGSKFTFLPPELTSLAIMNYLASPPTSKAGTIYTLKVDGHTVKDNPEFWGTMLIIGVPKDVYKDVPLIDRPKLVIC